MTATLAELLKDSAYKLSQFKPEQISAIATDIQQKIDACIMAARQATQRATQLLDAAKRAVEIAIEDSEAAALD